MAHNRKGQSAGMQIGPVFLVMLLILLIGGGGVAYVWQKNEIRAMSQEKLRKERALHELQINNRKSRDILEKLLVPGNLDAKAREFKLGLAPCPPEQVVRIIEPVAAGSPVTNVTTGQLARRALSGIAAR